MGTGLRLKPTYQELIGIALDANAYGVKFPDRSAKQLREGFVLSQLDGEGARFYEAQQQQLEQQQTRELLLRRVAAETGTPIAVARAASAAQQTQTRGVNVIHQGQQTSRAQTADASTGEDTVYHDMAAGDDDDDPPDEPMDSTPAPHYEDHSGRIEQLRAEAQADVIARENQARVRLEVMRIEARQQNTRENDEAARMFNEQYQRAQAVLNAQRTAAQRDNEEIRRRFEAEVLRARGAHTAALIDIKQPKKEEMKMKKQEGRPGSSGDTFAVPPFPPPLPPPAYSPPPFNPKARPLAPPPKAVAAAPPPRVVPTAQKSKPSAPPPKLEAAKKSKPSAPPPKMAAAPSMSLHRQARNMLKVKTAPSSTRAIPAEDNQLKKRIVPPRSTTEQNRLKRRAD